MSLSVIFPVESKMSKAKMEEIKKALLKRVNLEKYTNKDIDKIKQNIGQIEGYLIVADKKKLPQYFQAFIELQFLDIFNNSRNHHGVSITPDLISRINCSVSV